MEASPICRGQNLTLETVLCFLNAMPKKAMNKSDFNSYAETRLKGWTQTHSQIARQMALYYEDDGICYPRFVSMVSFEDVFSFVKHWARLYYIPNPSTPSLKGLRPTNIYAFLKKAINEGKINFTETCNTIFEGISLNNLDKVRVYLTNFTDILVDNDKMSLNSSILSTIETVNPNNVEMLSSKEYFDYFGGNIGREEKGNSTNPPLQQIFYGAPGTGKSHKVKEVTETLPKSDVFRTTFHPDSDYSTFVGCYKPKMVKAPIRDGSGHEITSACEDEKKRIAYEYEPQAFLKAYVRAYETSEPVFLVIEEINRGNCAQIFGDMFQLLDRNENGESDYAIKPETAIQEFLNEKLEDCDIADEVIKSGEEMRLPANLHIWATMNTSDQSLFPIDSAFKRRWDWKYMPINTRKESWSIKVNGTEYSWSNFLEKINEEIGDVTSSEDKKLGFYFCKAENGIISAERFVSKVLFYIYNDVFKDYGFESSKNKDLFKDGDNKLAFGTFYSDNGSIREEKVDLFLKNLGVEDAKRNNMISNDEEDEDGNSSTTESSSRNYDKFSINGSGRYAKNNLAAECVKKYIELNPDITVEEVLYNWSDFKNLVPHFMESKDEFDARTDNSKRSHEIPCNGSVLYVAHNGYGSNGKAQILMDSVNQKGWGLTIERHNA